MYHFKDKVVVVTGSTQGLGERFVRDFASKGAKVCVLGRRLEKAKEVARDINKSINCVTAFAFRCDVSVAEEVEDVMKLITKEIGPIDILINNAAYHRSIRVVDTPIDEWDKQIAIDLNGVFYCTRAVLPSMLDRSYGKILNISSSAAKHYFPGFGAYSAAKGGMISFTKTVSEEVKNKNININSIYLGMTNTEYTRKRVGNDKAVTIDLDEMLQEEDVSKVAQFLVHDDSKAIMGAAIEVYGKKS